MTVQVKNPMFCTRDTTDCGPASALAQALAGSVAGLEVGKEYFTPAAAARRGAAEPAATAA